MPFSKAAATGAVRGRRLLGRDDDQVDAGADVLLDLGALPEGVVLGVLEDDLDLGMLGRGGFDVPVHLDAPGLAQVALAHADGPFRLGCGTGIGGGVGGRLPARAAGGEGQGGADDQDETQGLDGHGGSFDARRRHLRTLWNSTAPTMMTPVSMSRVASPTALMLRIFSR